MKIHLHLDRRTSLGLEMSMKRTGASAVNPKTNGAPRANPKNNGLSENRAEVRLPDLTVILTCLSTMRDGDFSVRLPGAWTGLAGKIADTFNDIVAANQQMARELTRVGQAVGKEGRTRERAKFRSSRGAWGEMETSVNTLMEDLLRPTAEVTRAIAA